MSLGKTLIKLGSAHLRKKSGPAKGSSHPATNVAGKNTGGKKLSTRRLKAGMIHLRRAHSQANEGLSKHRGGELRKKLARSIKYDRKRLGPQKAREFIRSMGTSGSTKHTRYTKDPGGLLKNRLSKKK